MAFEEIKNGFISHTFSVPNSSYTFFKPEEIHEKAGEVAEAGHWELGDGLAPVCPEVTGRLCVCAQNVLRLPVSKFNKAFCILICLWGWGSL